MIDGVTPYPAYKPSGIEWLGDVPAHWEIERLKSSVKNVVEHTADHSKAGPIIALENVKSWTGGINGTASTPSFDSQLKRFRAGDVLFGKLRPYLAKVARLTTDGLCVGEFLVLRPRHGNIMEAHLEHLFRSKPIIDTINSSTFGARMPRADWQFIGRMPIPFPPLPEQAAIARFLDHMDRRITRCISAKEKLIALLEEYRQAVVSEAVTGRFDVRTGKPYPAYKPSGIEWLGDVPAHWEIERLKSSVKNVVEQTADHSKAGPIIALENVKSWTGGINGTASTPSFDSQLKRFRAGDVLFGKLRPYLAKVARLTTDGLCVGEFLVLRPRHGNIMEAHLEHLFRSKPIIDTINSSTFGARMPRADWQFIGRMPIPFPPLPEQAAIARFLDGKIEKVREGVARAQGEIDLLREWRTRLIADVVTGKLDVRVATAELPETAPLAPADGTDAPADDAPAPDSPDRAA